MNRYALGLTLSIMLTNFGLQEASQTEQSVAEAAKAARERRKASSHVVTEDELPVRNQAGASAGNEAQTRASLERSYPTINAVDMTNEVNQAQALSKMTPEKVADDQKQTLMGYKKMQFPGKDEWEAQIKDAAARLIEEAGVAYPKLQEILDTNRPAILKQDPASMKGIKAQWFDALVPYMSWHAKLRQILTDGEARAEAYAASHKQ